MSSSLNTIKTPNLFVYLPPHQNDRRPTIVYFITGNPGLIGYYHHFLTLLCQRPESLTASSEAGQTSSSSSTGRDTVAENCVVAGFSLGGFDLQEDKDSATREARETSNAATTTAGSGLRDQVELNEDERRELLYPSGFQRKQVYGLRDQIQLCYARLNALVDKVRREYGPGTSEGCDAAAASRTGDSKSGGVVNVILMGHSVGAYIALEMQRLHHARYHNPPPSPLSEPSLAITSNILLTPTILNIAHSPSGRLATPLLNTLPFLPAVAQLASSGLTSLIPASPVKWLISKVTGMPMGSEALDATVALLGAGGVVRQALMLARDEMREIGAQEWGEEVWGVVKDDRAEGRGWRAPKLYLWFAKGDHWVADVTRDEIVKMVREKFGDEVPDGVRDGQRQPEIVVDEDDGLVHAWCIAQSELVARKVEGWLKESLCEVET